MKKDKLGHILQKCASLLEEDQPLLFSEENYEKGDYSQISCETVIAQGAVKFLQKWPSHLCAVFLAGCFIITIILIIIPITIFLSFPTAYHRCRQTRNVEVGESHNVYFVKHENRTWSRKELCYIETAARKHPELKIYLINIESEDSQDNASQVWKQVTDVKNDSLFSTFVSLYEQDKSSMSRNLTPEMFLRKKIAYHNSNVRNIDIPTERFFRGSMIHNVYKKLSYEILEIAAKAYILWNYPGIALNPLMYNGLNDVLQYFCDKNKETCKPDYNFTIELKGDLQASGIPCHAFAEFLMQEIIKNRLHDQQYGLKRVLHNFCPRIQYCPGIRILKVKSSYLSSELFCPTIYPEGLFADFEDVLQKTTENLTT